MPETLNDADRTFIAHWARAIIKSVFEVGATISAIFWLPFVLSYLRPEGQFGTAPAVAALATFACLISAWNADRQMRSAEKTIDQLREE
jgi:hypothetical protein